MLWPGAKFCPALASARDLPAGWAGSTSLDVAQKQGHTAVAALLRDPPQPTATAGIAEGQPPGGGRRVRGSRSSGWLCCASQERQSHNIACDAQIVTLLFIARTQYTRSILLSNESNLCLRPLPLPRPRPIFASTTCQQTTSPRCRAGCGSPRATCRSRTSAAPPQKDRT